MAKKVKLERFEQKHIMDDLRSFQKYVTTWKNMRTSENNIADIIVSSCLTGPFAIELKKSDEDLRGGQFKKMRKLNKTGFPSYGVSGRNGYIKLKKHLGLTLENLRRAHELNEINIRDESGVEWENEFIYK